MEQPEIAASDSPSQASHMHVWPRNNMSWAWLCRLEQIGTVPLRDSAVSPFQRKEEKGV